MYPMKATERTSCFGFNVCCVGVCVHVREKQCVNSQGLLQHRLTVCSTQNSTQCFSNVDIYLRKRLFWPKIQREEHIYTQWIMARPSKCIFSSCRLHVPYGRRVREGREGRSHGVNKHRMCRSAAQQEDRNDGKTRLECPQNNLIWEKINQSFCGADMGFELLPYGTESHFRKKKKLLT